MTRIMKPPRTLSISADPPQPPQGKFSVLLHQTTISKVSKGIYVLIPYMHYQRE